MISNIILSNLHTALQISKKQPHIRRLLHLRGEVGPQHKKWLINETPKFYLQIAGQTRLQYPGGRLQIKQHEVLLMAPHIPHHETKVHSPAPYTALVVNFRSGKMQVIISGASRTVSPSAPVDRDYISNTFRPASLETIRLLLNEEKKLPPQTQSTLLLSFLKIIHCGYTAERPAPSVLPPLISQTLQRIDENISDSSLTVSQLARQAGCSSEHLSRTFSHQMGVPLKEHLIQQRLKLAADILISRPSATISAVAFMAGFSSAAYFCASFRKYKGCSPAAFRMANISQ